MSHVGIVIPCHNRKNITFRCIDNLQKIVVADFSISIFLIDDGSTDGTAKLIERCFHDKVKILKGDGNLFWTAAVNKGIMFAVKEGCDYVLLVNDDIEFEADFLIKLLEVSRKNPGSIVGSITCDADRRDLVVRGGAKIEKSIIKPLREIKGINLKSLKHRFYDVDTLSGRAVLVPVSVFNEIGLFDHVRYPHAFADLVYFYKAKKNGYRITICTHSIVYTKIEYKMANQLLMPSKYDSLAKFWFDNKYYGIKAMWHFSEMSSNRYLFMGYQFLKKIKWSIFVVLFSREKLQYLLDEKNK